MIAIIESFVIHASVETMLIDVHTYTCIQLGVDNYTCTVYVLYDKCYC